MAKAIPPATPPATSAPTAPRGRRRWAYQTSLFQFRSPAFWAYAAIVLVTGAYQLSEQSAFRRISPAGWALSWGLLAFYALPVIAAVYFLDLYEREPLSLLIGVFLWGALAATTFAGLGNDGWGLVVARVGGPEFAARWTAALTAPWIEESVKAAGVVMIVLIARDEVDDVLDGFVYGAVCGLGFAVVEDVFYFMGVFGGKPSGVLEGFYVRVVSSGLYGHVLWTGLAGMGIASITSARGEISDTRRRWVAAGLFAAAVAGHFLWDSPLFDFFPRRLHSLGDWLLVPWAAAVKGVPLLAFFGVMVMLARRREDRWLDSALRSEVGGAGLLPGEAASLTRGHTRRQARRDMRARAGSKAASLLRRLQREQVNLAMVRARVDRDDAPDLVRQRALCKSLRDALNAIPSAAPAEAGSAP